MDIYRELAGGDRRSIGRADSVAQAVVDDPRLFDQLFEGMLHQDPVIAMRCADAAEKVTRSRPDLLHRYGQRLIDETGRSTQAEVCWHVALMLPRADLTTAQRRQAADLLHEYLRHDSRIVRCNALEGLTGLAEQDDELAPAIRRTIEEHSADDSPAVRVRARIMLTRLRNTTGASSGIQVTRSRRDGSHGCGTG